MGIATIVGALLLVIIVNSAGLFYSESSKVSQGLGINDALSKIRASITQSKAVVTSFTSDGTTYTSSGSQIVLKIPSLDSLNNLMLDVFDYVVFFQDQTKLRYKLFPDAASFRKPQDQIFSTSVDSLSFKYFDSQNPPNEVTPASVFKVRISLTLKQKSGGSFEINTATSEANLRND